MWSKRPNMFYGSRLKDANKKRWNAQVCISEEVYAHHKIVMGLLRLHGLFPLVVKRKKSRLYLQWSPWFAVYGYMLGGLVLTVAIYAQVKDIFASKASLYVIFNTDKVARMFALFGHLITTFSALFVAPSMFLQFFDYMGRINQIDSIIGTTYTKSDQQRTIVVLILMLIPEVTAQLIHYYLSYVAVGHQVGVFGILNKYMMMTIASEVTLMMQYTNRHLVYGLKKRIIRLNQLLEEKYLGLVKVGQIRGGQLLTIGSSKDITTLELREVSLKLLASFQTLNHLLEPNIFFSGVSLCLFSIICPYFLILTLEGKRRGGLEVIANFFVVTMVIIRLLLITEPWYECMAKMETTKNLVCKLLSLKVNRRFTRRLKHYSVILGLKQLRSSAYGLFHVDRSALTSLIGTTTTFCVILLQAQHDEK